MDKSVLLYLCFLTYRVSFVFGEKFKDEASLHNAAVTYRNKLSPFFHTLEYKPVTTTEHANVRRALVGDQHVNFVPFQSDEELMNDSPTVNADVNHDTTESQDHTNDPEEATTGEGPVEGKKPAEEKQSGEEETSTEETKSGDEEKSTEGEDNGETTPGITSAEQTVGDNLEKVVFPTTMKEDPAETSRNIKPEKPSQAHLNLNQNATQDKPPDSKANMAAGTEDQTVAKAISHHQQTLFVGIPMLYFLLKYSRSV